MNDLRSRNRTLAPVRPLGPSTGEIVSTPPRARAIGNPLFQDSRAGLEPERSERRQPPAGKSQAAKNRARGRTQPVAQTTAEIEVEVSSPLNSPVSQELRTMPVSTGRAPEGGSGSLDAVSTSSEPETDLRDGDNVVTTVSSEAGVPSDGAREPKAPANRPSKRRDVADERDAEEEKFPWHFSFAANNDEPQELQAKSPLLARAFRSSVG